MIVNKNNVRFFQVETANEGHYQFDTIEQVYGHMAKHGYTLYFFGEPDMIGDVTVTIPALEASRESYRQAKKRYFGI
tara:strand:+ start:397 stop:627 length:231 start_codon:yes stop_codon:yes gene_type:complete